MPHQKCHTFITWKNLGQLAFQTKSCRRVGQRLIKPTKLWVSHKNLGKLDPYIFIAKYSLPLLPPHLPMAQPELYTGPPSSYAWRQWSPASVRTSHLREQIYSWSSSIMHKSLVNFKYPISRISKKWTQVHKTNMTGKCLGNKYVKYQHCH